MLIKYSSFLITELPTDNLLCKSFRFTRQSAVGNPAECNMIRTIKKYAKTVKFPHSRI